MFSNLLCNSQSLTYYEKSPCRPVRFLCINAAIRTLTRIELLSILVPAKGPTITSITPTARSLKVTWNKLSSDDSNGEITKYEVFYQLGSTVSISSAKRTFTGVDNTTVELTGLKPAKMYTVAVRAFTKIGPGPLGDGSSETTSESGKFVCYVCNWYLVAELLN